MMKPFIPVALSVLLIAGCTANARMDLSSYQPPKRTAATAEPGVEETAPPTRGDRAYADKALPPASGERGGRGPEVMTWGAARSEPSDGRNEVHIVREGDTLYSIAQQNGVTLAMLYSANGLLNDRLTPGQHILVPRRGAAVP